jgi:hypothetical protein
MRTHPSGRRLLAAVAATTMLFTVAGPVSADPIQIAEVTVDPQATLDPQDNTVTVHGTVTCLAAGSVEFNVEAFQTIGQANIHGFGFGDRVCTGADPTPLPWSAVILPDSSPFNPGTIDLFIFNPQCGEAGCIENVIEGISVEARPTDNRPPPPPPPPPANDEPAGAIAIGLGTVTADTTNATASETDAFCGSVLPFVSHTVWYSFTAPASGWVEVNTVGSNFDTTLHVLDASGVVVACNDDIVGGEIRQSQLVFEATAGATYLIQVGSWEATTGGALMLTLAPTDPPPTPPGPPANDSRSAPATLTVGAEPITSSTVAATADPAEDPADGECGFPINGATVWYAVTAAADGWISVNTFGSDYDTTLVVYDGAEIIGCNDQAAQSNQSEVTFAVSTGETYLVMVGSWAAGPGGSLTIEADEAEEPLSAELTPDLVATVAPGSGDATLSGTIICSEPATGFVFVSLIQEGGRFTANGTAEAEISCGPTPTPISIVVTSPGPKYQAGEAFAFAQIFLETADGKEFSTFIEGPITLRPAGSLR